MAVSVTVVILMLRVLPRVIVLPREVAVGVLVITRVAESIPTGLDEAQSNSEDDVEAGGELH